VRWARILFSGRTGASSPGKKLGPETIQQTDHDMEKRFFINGILGGVLSLGLLTIQTSFSQSALQFTGVNATPKKAIHSQPVQVISAGTYYLNSCGDSMPP
jgi:hypothetical protein